MKKNPNAKYIERLEQLIRVMRGLTRHERTKHFNMQQWGVKTECGTTMCAAGFCGSDPWFRRKGFRLSKDPHGTDDDGLPILSLDYGKSESWGAVLSFFGSMEGDGTYHEWGGGSVAFTHPVFATPESVGEVIRAAKARIKLLKGAA